MKDALVSSGEFNNCDFFLFIKERVVNYNILK